MTMHLFEQIVRERFGGRLAWGAHEADSVACALEAAHAAMGDPWSDRPDRWPDIRPLNDGPWSSDTARTEALVPLLIAYWDWAEWSVARRQRVMDCLVRLTVQQLIAELPGLPAPVVAQCRAAATVQEVKAAAEAASRAAAGAAWAGAGAAAVDRMLRRACALWIEAATHGGHR